VLDQGRLVQYATPDDIIQHPQTHFVARFIGLGHFLSGEIHEKHIVTEIGQVPYNRGLTLAHDCRQVDVLIRPEHIQLCTNHQGIPAQVLQIGFRGTSKLYTLRLPSGTTLCATLPAQVTPRPGERIAITWQPLNLVVFPRRSVPELSTVRP
jgi:iron(III) transport system ATP-binding protein